MTTYVIRDGKLVEKSRANADPRLHVISDHLDYVLNPATGLRYSSKRAYERDTTRAGCVIIGNEKFPERKPYDPGPVGPDVKAAIEQLRSR